MQMTTEFFKNSTRNTRNAGNLAYYLSLQIEKSECLNNSVSQLFFLTGICLYIFALSNIRWLHTEHSKNSNRKTRNAVKFTANYHYYYLQNRSKAFKLRKTFSSDGLPCRNCKIAIVNSVYTSSKTCNGNKTWAAFHTVILCCTYFTLRFLF